MSSSQPMRPCLVALFVSLVPGCYLSHGLGDAPPPPSDAGSRLDSGRIVPRTDGGRDAAPRDGDYWTLEVRGARLGIAHELGCTQFEGGRIALVVTTPIETLCEHAGPVGTVVADDGTVVVTAYVWVEHRGDPSACPMVSDTTSHRTVLLPAHEGWFRARTEGFSPVELRVGAIDDLPCTFAGSRDAPCRLDCECNDGRVCIPQLGDFVACEGGHCGDPCQPPTYGIPSVYGDHLECDASEQCRSGPALAMFSCQPIEGGGCDPSGAACGPGLVCPPTGEVTECQWDIALNGANRHSCRGNSECDRGLFCVEHATGERRCEVPCFTNEMGCPFMHVCEADRWVCEWLGE